MKKEEKTRRKTKDYKDKMMMMIMKLTNRGYNYKRNFTSFHLVSKISRRLLIKSKRTFNNMNNYFTTITPTPTPIPNANANDNINTNNINDINYQMKKYMSTRTIIPESRTNNNHNNHDNHSSLFNEKKATAIQFNWFESETDYNIEARLLVGVNPENLHLYIQNHQIIFETKSDSTDDKQFQSDRDTKINVVQHSSLYLRRTIDIPKNVHEENITAKISGDVVAIKMPKTNTIEDETSRKDIKIQK